ncbi:MAG TPA: ATP-binding cassette domain-containing protein [Bacteroidales bacterium]|nr:ATP-binding cassette domain-containing protein [Bacteroidales bacterium]
MIETRNISKRFGSNEVLIDISTSFHRGKTNLIIGASGSGKTVLMKCLVGLLPSDSGEVFYDGRPFSAFSMGEVMVIRREIGMLFQGGALFDSMTVEENVMFPLTMFTDMSLPQKRERANFCLNRVNLVNVNQLLPSELSGGMKKRVAIARAIAMNPRYLFCDEPNSGLDPQTANVIDRLISDITAEFEITTVVNTHDMNSVLEIGESVIFLHQSKLWWTGDKHQILNSDNEELNRFVFSTTLTQKLQELKKTK